MDVGIVVILSVLALPFLHQQTTNEEYAADTFTDTQLNVLQEKLKLTFPPATQKLHLFVQNESIDRAWAAKLFIPESSAFFFTEQLEKIQGKNVTIHGGLTKQLAWWDVDILELLIDCYYNPMGNVFTGVHIQVVKRNDGIIVYVEAYDF